MAFPSIVTAIPKRRYQYGEFNITLLTEITSQDPVAYLYIAAIMQEGKTTPEVYITCEPISAGESGQYRVRVLSDQSEHIINEAPQWNNEQAFCDFALQGVAQMFELSDEKPILLA